MATASTGTGKASDAGARHNAAARELRNERAHELKAAGFNGESVERRLRRREASASEWLKWFHDLMDRRGARDPTELLPEFAAKLEQSFEDRIAEALREFKSALKKAL